MYRPLRSLLLLVFVVAVMVLPSMGPLMDHHYAERQPGHMHLGLPVEHTHSDREGYAHLHQYETYEMGGVGSISLFAYDGMSVPTIVTVEAYWDSLLDFEAGSLFNFLLPVLGGSRQHYVAPQEKPPQLGI